MNRNTAPGLVLVIAIGLFLTVTPTAAWLTDLMWFQSLDLERVFWVTTAAQAAAAGGVGLVAFAAVWVSGRLALRHTPSGPVALPADMATNPMGQALANTPATRLVTWAALGVAALMGLQGFTWWDELLLATHGASFDWADPLLGIDAGFYVFVLPLLVKARGAALGIVVLSALLAAGIYFTRGGVKVQLVEMDGQLVARGVDVRPEARRHLASLVALFLLLMALGAYLQRYTLLYDQSGLFAGPGYADVHGTLPLLILQAIATALAAGLAYVAVDRFQTGPLLGAGALVLVFGGVTSAYPGFVQRFSVLPNELNREGPHLIDHIEATRHAFKLDGVEELTLSGDAIIDVTHIESNRATVNNVRLWDHEPLLATFAQLQEIRPYYTFENVDNDRYRIGGELRQIMLSPRELLARNLPEQARTWVNVWMTYTHGYGVALGPVNQVTTEGLPELFIYDLPPKFKFPSGEGADVLHIDRPEIYFGEAMTTPVIVNTDNPEFDYPAGDDNEYVNYTGSGGVPLGTFGRALFSIRFASTEFLFSSDIHEESRVLLHRNLVERIERIAPYLLLDSDPYMVIADGKLVWVVDAYTQASSFPYSRALARPRANYLRNAVKITVDAYNGEVRFYISDPDDPIVQAWARAFPGLYGPLEELPPTLREHLRYPQDWFNVQSGLFAIYHMQDHQLFYNREDEWEIPDLGGAAMAPYYTVMKLPGESREEFIVMLPYTPASKDNLSAWMVARMDGDDYGTLRVYKFPKEKLVYGPSQISARINQDDEISEKISLWNQQGSKVEMGTMLVIPIEESLIYVQPLYLKADNGSIPELKRVIVAYGDQKSEQIIAMQPTLELGLLEIFGKTRATAPAEPSGEPRTLPVPLSQTALWGELAGQAAAQWDAANEAMRGGDWAAYGEAIEALGLTIEQLRGLSDTAAEPEPPAQDPLP